MPVSHVDKKVQSRYPIFSRVASYYRKKRQEAFFNIFKPDEHISILDVGGLPYYWGDKGSNLNITLLNIEDMKTDLENIKTVRYDGGIFPFTDKSFDIVFSNSTIEHVGDFWDKKLFASEIQRVGKNYWIQTPNFYFPWEPHAQIPFFQFLPGNFKLMVNRILQRSQYPVEELLSIRLLTSSELKYLFPHGTILRERFLFWTKSFIVCNK